MQLDGQDLWAFVASAIGGGGSVFFVVKWVLHQIDNLRNDARKAREEMVAQAEKSEERCRQESSDLAARLRHLEDLSHQEQREDRVIILEALKMNAAAFSQLADKWPDWTPPRGAKALDDHS